MCHYCVRPRKGDLIQTLHPVPGKLLRTPFQAVLAVGVSMRFSVVVHTITPALEKPNQKGHCKIDASLGYPLHQMLASSTIEQNPD